MAAGTVRVRGLREFQRAVRKAEPDSRKEVRAALKQAVEPVRQEAVRRFTPVYPRSAVNYRTVVRQRGVAVEQRLRKTTGLHPEYGALQMRRALIPALQANETRIVAEVDKALDRVADHFERSP